MRRLKHFAVLGIFAVLLSLPLKAVAFDPFGGSCKAGQAQNSAICGTDKNTTNSIVNNPISGRNSILQESANTIAAVGGISAIIVMILAGISYATAGGAQAGQRAGDNPTKAKNARVALTSAAIGLVALALTWAGASFIIQRILP